MLGLSGVAIGVGAACACSGLACIILPAKIIGSNPWRVARELSGAFGAAAVSGVFCFGMLRVHAAGLAWTLVSILAAGILYLALLVIFEGRKLREDFEMMRRMFMPDLAALE
jgi:hypothetical protein